MYINARTLTHTHTQTHTHIYEYMNVCVYMWVRIHVSSIVSSENRVFESRANPSRYSQAFKGTYWNTNIHNWPVTRQRQNGTFSFLLDGLAIRLLHMTFIPSIDRLTQQAWINHGDQNASSEKKPYNTHTTLKRLWMLHLLYTVFELILYKTSPTRTKFHCRT